MKFIKLEPNQSSPKGYWVYQVVKNNGIKAIASIDKNKGIYFYSKVSFDELKEITEFISRLSI